MSIPSGATPGPRLADDLTELRNNVYGFMHGISAASLDSLANEFVRIGWRARRSARDEYEVECTWCSVNVFDSDGMVKFAGVVDPDRVDELAAALGALGIDYEIELYDQADELVRKLRPN
jgi:hypothetical protein